MTSREQRRKQLMFNQEHEIKHIKNTTLDIPLEDRPNQEAVEKLITKHLMSAIQFEFHIKTVALTILNIEEIMHVIKHNNPLVALVKITSKQEEGIEEQTIEVPINYSIQQPKQKHALYFEAIIQLRDTAQSILDEINALLEKNNVAVAKVIKQKRGIDIYVADNHKAQSIMNQIKRKHGGTITTSKKIQGHNKQKSRDLYRVTILYQPN